MKNFLAGSFSQGTSCELIQQILLRDKSGIIDYRAIKSQNTLVFIA